MNKAFTAAQPQIKSYDPIWEQVRREAEETSANEPVLASLIYATILSEPTLEDAVCHTVAHRLQPSRRHRPPAQDVPRGARGRPGPWRHFPRRHHGRRQARSGLPPPASSRCSSSRAFMRFETYRFAHRLWQSGRKDFALYLQSQSSRVLRGRHSSRGADRQGHHARPRDRHRHRRDGGGRRQLLACCMA